MVRIDDSLITAQTLESRLTGDERQVEVCPRAKLTPSALDLLRARQIQVVKRSATSASHTHAQTAHQPTTQASGSQPAGVPEAPGGTERSRRFSGIFTPNIVIYDEAGNINYKEMERYIG
ncbi:MAG: hypothetical protein HOB49_24825, partial [Gemmatimonadetes bacterium]|nr:hypothetical protein [Gemmatimonadota bacterium]